MACSEDEETCRITRRGLDNRVVRVEGDCRGRSFHLVDLSEADVARVTWGDNVCPDGTLSAETEDGTCLNHLSPGTQAEDLPDDVDDLFDGVEEDSSGDMPDDVEVQEDLGEDTPDDVPDGDMCEPNACGGCRVLSDELGGACDACGGGAFVCDGQNALRCEPEAFCLQRCEDNETCLGRGLCSNGRCVPPGAVFAPAGQYLQGEGEVTRQTTLTRALLVQQTEVTQRQWMELMGNNPSFWRDCDLNCPVETISWYEALVLANRWSQAEGLPACYWTVDSAPTVYSLDDASRERDVSWPSGPSCTGWRIPTEAEWEYVARAGSSEPWSCGQDISCLMSVARYGLTEDDGPTTVMSFMPNAWGLFDVHGNVEEWCWDLFADWPEGETLAVDPIGPSQALGSLRGLRGGFYSSLVETLRTGTRDASYPQSRFDTRGVRLVRSLNVGDLPE